MQPLEIETNIRVAVCGLSPRALPYAPLRHLFRAGLPSMFCEMFRHLPVCSVIHDKVLVIHGGLFHREGVKLADIDEVGRMSLVKWLALYLLLSSIAFFITVLVA